MLIWTNVVTSCVFKICGITQIPFLWKVKKRDLNRCCEIEVFVNSCILRNCHYCGCVNIMNLRWAWDYAISEFMNYCNLQILGIWWNNRMYKKRKCEHPNAAKTKQGERFRYIQCWLVDIVQWNAPSKVDKLLVSCLAWWSENLLISRAWQLC